MYTKTLGIEWNTVLDHFRLTISAISPPGQVTKRLLISDVSKIFDVFGWLSPCTVKMKIQFQRLWELKLCWDEPVPEEVHELWSRWRIELPLLSNIQIPRCFFKKDSQVSTRELHGFSDASEKAYSAVVYLRIQHDNGTTLMSLVSSKTKVAPLKKLTIPRLELCGARLLSQLISHIQSLIKVERTSTNWTETIVLNRIAGEPSRLRSYVGNRIAEIIELMGRDCWRHVRIQENPADCASKGLFPSELTEHELWWHGPK